MDAPNNKMSKSTPTPSFFKILYDDIAPNLPLPPLWVKKHFPEEIFPENSVVVLKTESGERSWRVKIEEIGGKYSFGNGWLQFVKEAKVEVKDFLIFWLVGKFTFKVSIYGSNACAKNLTSAPPTLSNCVCSCSRSRVSNDDEDYDGKEEEENDDENEIEGQGFKEESLKPFFEEVLSKYHYHIMTLPSHFVNETGMENQRKIMLRNQERKEWPVKIGRYVDRLYLGDGWSDFWLENRLMEGDTCSFKYQHGEGGRNSSLIEFEFVKKVPRKRGRPHSIKRSIRP